LHSHIPSSGSSDVFDWNAKPLSALDVERDLRAAKDHQLHVGLFCRWCDSFKEEAVEPIRKRLRAQRHCGQRIEPPRFAEVITLQLLSYFVAMYSGIDVDHPRNLVKAVVTE
jgi:glucosamine 6-phosphate synthetase-like amidotransferase/phosphosugar isomerase protein